MDGYRFFLPENKEKKKIPYDTEPISRTNSRNVGLKVQKTNRLISLLVAVIIISNVIFGVLIFSLWQNTPKTNSVSQILTNDSRNNTSSTTTQNPSVTEAATSFAIRSVVSIRAYHLATPPPQGQSDPCNIGAGIIISDNNNTVSVVTNFHVVYTNNQISSRIKLFFWDDVGEENPVVATYVGGAYNYDIVVLQFNIGPVGSETPAGLLYKNSSACKTTFADSADINVGENVFAIGNPQGLGISLTSGSVSKPFTEVQVDVNSDNNAEVLRVIQTDAAINGGNSGGGLFNAQGFLIGIVNSKLVYDGKGDPLEGMAYAIPSNVVRGVAHNVTANGGQLKMCKLGVYLSSTSYSVEETVAGVLSVKIKFNVSVSSFAEGSVAFDAGVREGDKLLKLGYLVGSGEQTVTEWVDIDKPFTIEDNMFWFSGGDTIKLVVERNGEERTFGITLVQGVLIE